MLVRRDARQSFQHFVAGDLESGGTAIRQERAPDRMRVQDGAGTARGEDGVVQPGLGGRSAGPGENDTRSIELENIVRRELALVRAAARDREAQRLARDHRAEVPARAEHPPTRVEAVAGLDDLVDQRHTRCADYMGTRRTAASDPGSASGAIATKAAAANDRRRAPSSSGR